MMKKFYAMLVVVALVLVSSMAFAAAEVTIGGSVDIRSRNFKDLDMVKSNGAGSEMDTNERIRLDVNVKAGDVKGKITIENDYDTWGRFESVQGVSSVTTGTAVSTTKASRLGLREAWMLFPIPNTPVYIKGGHMLLQLGQGWWFRSMKYGSDAWVAYTDIDALHLGFVNVKVSEGVTSSSDDIDAYVLVATMKASDTIKFGADITYADDRRNGLGFGTPVTPGNDALETEAINVGLNFDGKLGPVGLKAEADMQTGKAKGNDSKFKGWQVVAQGTVPMDVVTINFTLASGTGRKADDTDHKQMVTFLDADQHYTLLYEYKIAGPCGAHTGFCGTTAASAGAMFAATKTLGIGADLWFMQASAKVDDKTDALTAPGSPTTSELGMEIDVKVNWTLADNLTWNWTLGYLDPGKGLGKDASTGVQGVLSMKF